MTGTFEQVWSRCTGSLRGTVRISYELVGMTRVRGQSPVTARRTHRTSERAV